MRTHKPNTNTAQEHMHDKGYKGTIEIGPGTQNKALQQNLAKNTSLLIVSQFEQ
jgi:hypothetical protein